MKLSTRTLAFVSTLVSLASAGCYNGGADWPSDHASTLAAIQAASYEFELDSPLSKGEHIYDTQVGNKCLHFVLDNKSGDSRSIKAAEASDGFSKEYRGCANGGDTTYTNWRYV